MKANLIVGALLFIVLFVVAIAAFSAVLWFMIPLAFPLLPWTYWNALALAWIILLVGLPWLVSN
jgi:hypothetical protein